MEKPWLKFYDPHVPPSIEYPPLLLPQILDDTADQYPQKAALFFFGGRMSYGKLRAQVNQFASALERIQFQRGERLGLLLANMPQAVISIFGTLKAGGLPFLFDPLAEDEDLAHQFAEAQIDTLVALDLVLPRIERMFGERKFKNLIVTGVQDYLPFPRNKFFTWAARGRGMHVRVARKSNLLFFREFLFGGRSDFSVSASNLGNPGDGAVVLFSRKKSEPSRGVLLTHKNLIAGLFQVSAWMGKWEKGKETFLSIPPFHQAYGITLAMNLPICLAAMSIPLPRFDMNQVLSLIRKHHPSFFPAFSSIVENLSTSLSMAKLKRSSIKISLSIGECLPEENLHSFERRVGGKLSEGYGLAEAAGLTHANPIYGKRKIGSIGIPLPDTEAKIVDARGGEKEVRVGGIGELVIRGPQVMKGYWNRLEESQRALRHGWLHTGNLARMDEDGFFYMTGKPII